VEVGTVDKVFVERDSVDDIFYPPAPDAVRMCSGPCGDVKPSTSFPTVAGRPGARRGECRTCRDQRLVCEPFQSAMGDSSATKYYPPGGRRDPARSRRQAVAAAVAKVLVGHPGVAVGISQVCEEVLDCVDFVPAEADVRSSLRELAKSDEHFVRVGRQAYAWAPDGKIPPLPPPTHVVDMIERRWRGETLDEIGTAFGVTRERVRQLMKKYGGPSSSEIRDVQLARTASEEEARRNAIGREIRGALSKGGPATAEDVASETGIAATDVWKFWPADLLHLRLWGFGSHESRWSDEEILDAIRQAAVYEFPLTANAYSDLLSVGQVEGPSLPRIGQRFGSWSAACEAAGVVPGQTMRTHYESQWSDSDILTIVRRYLEDPAVPNSIQGYDAWRRTNAPDGPSGQTIRNRFRTWTEVKRIALSYQEGTQEAVRHE